MSEPKELPPLTDRGRRLIQKLAELPRAWQTTAALAQALDVSRRTVMRELPQVEAWIRQAGFHFSRTPGCGIRFDEDAETCQKIISLVVDQTPAPLPKTERRLHLLEDLLAAHEPCKTFTLAHDLSTSEHILSGDLDWAKAWFRPYRIRLLRRPGVGVWLDASAGARRQAASALLRAKLMNQDTRAGIETAVLSLSKLFDVKIAVAVWHLLQDFEREENLHISDTGFLTLAVHCALTVQQLQSGEWEPPEHPTEPHQFAESERASRLAARMEQTFHLKLPEGEIQHFALYLRAYGGPMEPVSVGEMELREFAMYLITCVERDMHVDFSGYPSLPQDLSRHLQPMLYRVRQGSVTENPQLPFIQQQYPELWEATRSACQKAAQKFDFPPIPDAEAGFLAMHFGAVLANARIQQEKIRVAVVCPYGIASSKFLASQLLREFSFLEVSINGSIRDLSVETLRNQGIRLVISTVPLRMDYPKVCVNTILQEIDRTLLRAAFQEVQQIPAPPSVPSPSGGLRCAGRLSTILLDLLDNLTIATADCPQDRTDFITQASHLFCKTQQDSQMVARALLRREALGETYIRPLMALLLHCRTPVVSGCRVGYLRSDPPLYGRGQIIQGALLLLIPDTPDELPLKVMQTVSEILIEEPTLIEALRVDKRAKAISILETEFSRRFRLRPDLS